MNRRALRHIIVESGWEMISGRGRMDDWAIEQLTPVVNQAVKSGRRTRVLGGYWIQCQLREGGLAVAIGHAGADERILVSMTVQPAPPHDLPVPRVRTVGPYGLLTFSSTRPSRSTPCGCPRGLTISLARKFQAGQTSTSPGALLGSPAFRPGQSTPALSPRGKPSKRDPA